MSLRTRAVKLLLVLLIRCAIKGIPLMNAGHFIGKVRTRDDGFKGRCLPNNFRQMAGQMYFLIEFFRKVNEEMKGGSTSLIETHEPSNQSS